MRMNWINVVWLFLFPAIMLFEGIAVADERGGNTISENAWRIRSVAVGRYVLWPGMMWLCYHILLETPGSGFGWEDGVAIVVGLVGATWRTLQGLPRI